MRCNESLIEISTLAMHNQQVSISATNNNMISTLDDKSSTTFQTPNVPPKENTIEVSIIKCDTNDSHFTYFFNLTVYLCSTLFYRKI